MKLIKACAVLTTAVMMSGCALVCKTQHTKQTETDYSYTTTTVTQYGLFGLSDTRKYGNKTTQGIAGLFLPLYASKTEDVKWKSKEEREAAKKSKAEAECKKQCPEPAVTTPCPAKKDKPSDK